MRDSNIYLSSRVPYPFLLAPTTPQELSDIIKDLDDTKSSGPTLYKMFEISKKPHFNYIQ